MDNKLDDWDWDDGFRLGSPFKAIKDFLLFPKYAFPFLLLMLGMIALCLYCFFTKDKEKVEDNLNKFFAFPPLLKFNEDGTVEPPPSIENENINIDFSS